MQMMDVDMNMRNKNRTVVFLLVIIVISIALYLFWPQTENTKKQKTPENFIATSEEIINYSYEKNTIGIGNKTHNVPGDIATVKAYNDQVLVTTVPNPKYPKGQYLVYNKSGDVEELSENLFSSKWTDQGLIYSISEAETGKSDIYIYSPSRKTNELLTSINHANATVSTTNDYYLISYPTGENTVDTIAFNHISGEVTPLNLPREYLISSASDDLRYYVLAPINGAGQPYSFYDYGSQRLATLSSEYLLNNVIYYGDMFYGLTSSSDGTQNSIIKISRNGNETILHSFTDNVEHIEIDNGIIYAYSEGEKISIEI